MSQSQEKPPGLRVYNTLTKELEPFTPLEAGVVRMYNCGPTVYDYAHLGNFRTFAFADTLRRYLEYSGYRVLQIMNITDVGHMTREDVDAGEDRMEEGLRRLKAKGVAVDNPWQVAEYFMNAFFEDRRKLGFLDPMKFTRATEYVPAMIELIRALLDKGFAYRVGGNLYFDVTKFPAYGRLSGNTLEQIKAGARIEINPEKRHPADFALWKTDPKHLMQFESPWGRGFPGWHVECSAMSMNHLGETLDLHTGGEDNIFPHHECEIAQSEAATGKKFVRYWMHARHIMWDGQKMSKSLGNVFLIREAVERGYDPLEIRYGLIATHYRQHVNFSWKVFDDAKSALGRMREFRRRLQDVVASGRPATAKDPADMRSIAYGAKSRFARAMDDDLNTSGALAAVQEFVREVNRATDAGEVGAAQAKEALETLTGFDRVLGVLGTAEEAAPSEVQELVKRRQDARVRRDWKESDRLREEIKSRGWAVEDTKEGQKVKRAR